MSKQKHFVLLRGLTRESRHWGDFPNKLQRIFKDSKVTLLDLPGSGKHISQKCPTDITLIVQMLRGELDTLLLNQENIIFIGISLGGMVAMRWGELFSRDFKGLIIINSSSGSLTPFWNRIKLSALPPLLASLLMKKKRQSIIYDLVCNNQKMKRSTVELWEKIQREAPISLENTLRQIRAAMFFSMRKKLKVKTLILGASGDNLVSPQCSKDLARFLESPLKIHSWGGHELIEDDPEWVTKQIVNFTERVYSEDQ